VRRALPYAAVASAACSWGTWGLLIRHTEALGAMPTALESTIVMAVITIVSGLAMLCERRSGKGARGRAAWAPWAWVAWLGVGDAFNVLLFFAAYKITITVSVLSHYLTPVFVAAAAPLVLRERMTSRTAAAIALSFGGLVAIFAPGTGADGDAVWRSAALGAGSAVFYASNVIVNKFTADSFTTSETMFWHGVVATPLLAAFVPAPAWAAADARAVAFLAAVSIVPGGLAGLAFVWGLRRMPAAHASTLTLLEPLVSVALGIALMGERSSVHTLVGGSSILAGAVILATSRASRQPYAAPQVEPRT
jgi:drug/metabolite transporter (DMT)-like permease